MRLGLIVTQPWLLRLIFLASVFLATGCQRDPKAAETACTAENWQALEAVKSGDYKRASSLYKSALAEAERSANLLQLPQVLIDIAVLDLLRKNPGDAEAHLRASVQSYSKIEKSNRLLQTQLIDLHIAKFAAVEKLADVLADQNKLAEAEQFYNEAFHLDEAYGHAVEDHLRVERSYAKVLRAEKKNEAAEVFEVDVNANVMSKKDVEAEVMHGFARAEPGEALPVLRMKSVLLAAERFKRQDLIQMALYLLGLAELREFNVARADANFERLIQIVRPDQTGGIMHTYDENMAAVMVAHAWCFDLQGRSSEAKTLLERGIHLNVHGAWVSSDHFMKILYRIGKKQEAERVADAILQFPDKCDLKNSATAEVLSKDLMLCGGVGEFDRPKALLFHERALQVLEAHGGESAHPALMAEFLGNVADDCFSELKYARACRLYERAIPLFAKVKNPNTAQKRRLEENLAKVKATMAALLPSPAVSHNAARRRVE